MIDTVVDFLLNPQYTNIIQALSSIVLMMITAIYVYLTYVISSSHYMSYIRPVALGLLNETNGNKWSISIINCSSNLAIDVVVTTTAITSSKYSRHSKKYFNTIEIIKGEGPFEIKPGEIEDYSFNGFIEFEFPIEVMWKTLQNKDKKTSWKIININKPDEEKIVPVVLSDYMKYKVAWYGIKIKSPWVKINKIYYKYYKNERHL